MTGIEPRIEFLNKKKLIGLSMTMSLSQDNTPVLWKAFGPRIKDIESRVSKDKFSLQIYPKNYFRAFSPGMEFTKWAAVEISDLNELPNDLKILDLEEGMYAVFDYKGSSSDKSIFQYIFSQWLPHSDYMLDDRAHFEVLGDRYKNNDPESEEEIWIPIKNKR